MTRQAGPTDADYYSDKYQDNRDWMKDRACRGYDPEWWFTDERPGRPNAQKKRDHLAALEICGGCPVRITCLIYALELKIAYGTYGGVTEDQRAALMKRRKAR